MADRELISTKKHQCTYCVKAYTTRRSLRQHFRLKHVLAQPVPIREVFQCSICRRRFANIALLQTHKQTHEPETKFVVRNSAFRKTCITYRRVHGSTVNSIALAFLLIRRDVYNLLRFQLLTRNSMKSGLILMVRYLKYDKEGNPTASIDMALRSPTQAIFHESTIKSYIRKCEQDISGRSQDLELNGSGWRLDSVIYSDVECGTCKKIYGSCPSQRVCVKFMKHLYVSKSPTIKTSSSSTRDDCFLSALAYHFMQTEDQQVLDLFIEQHVNKCVKMPMAICDVSKFELGNPALGIRFNIVQVQDNSVFPLYRSKNLQFEQIVTLCLFESEDHLDPDQVISHYAYIVSLNSFMRDRYGKHFRSTKYYCVNCLHHFSSRRVLKNHEIMCYVNSACKITVPTAEETVKFVSYHNKTPLELIGVFDFETVAVKNVDKCDRCDADKACTCKSSIESTHEVICYAFILLDSEGNLVHQSSYAGEKDVVHTFLTELVSLEETLHDIVQEFRDRTPLSTEDEESFLTADKCYICLRAYTPQDYLSNTYRPVRDHNHRTSAYEGNINILIEFHDNT